MKYNEKINRELITLAEGAVIADVSYSRFRKTILRLKIPVTRAGWALFITRKNAERVGRAIKDGVIRRGRPPKQKESRARISNAALEVQDV
jgi:hypothetical protein